MRIVSLLSKLNTPARWRSALSAKQWQWKCQTWDHKAIHEKIIGTSVFYMGTTRAPPTHKKLSNDECPFTDMSVYLCSRCRRGEVTCLLSTWSRCMCLCCSWCNATVGESISVRWSHTPNMSTVRALARDDNFHRAAWYLKLAHIPDSVLETRSCGCPSIWPWNKLKCPVTPVPVSHNSKHHQQTSIHPRTT